MDTVTLTLAILTLVSMAVAALASVAGFLIAPHGALTLHSERLDRAHDAALAATAALSLTSSPAVRQVAFRAPRALRTSSLWLCDTVTRAEVVGDFFATVQGRPVYLFPAGMQRHTADLARDRMVKARRSDRPVSAVRLAA